MGLRLAYQLPFIFLMSVEMAGLCRRSRKSASAISGLNCCLEELGRARGCWLLRNVLESDLQRTFRPSCGVQETANTVVLTGRPDLPPVLAAGGERRSNQNSFSAGGSAHWIFGLHNDKAYFTYLLVLFATRILKSSRTALYPRHHFTGSPWRPAAPIHVSRRVRPAHSTPSCCLILFTRWNASVSKGCGPTAAAEGQKT
jgi:hypothetical protein